jgi:hypothetical protein
MAKHDLINPSVSHHCGTEQSPPSLPTMQSCPSQRCAVWPSNFRGFGPKGIDNSPRNIYMSAAPRSAFALNIPVQITCQCSVSVQSPVACSRSFPRPVPHSRHSHYSFLLPSALDEPHFASSASCISVATLLLLLAAAACYCIYYCQVQTRPYLRPIVACYWPARPILPLLSFFLASHPSAVFVFSRHHQRQLIRSSKII